MFGKRRGVYLSFVGITLAATVHAEDLREVVRSPLLIEEHVNSHNAFNAGDLWSALGLPPLVFPASVERQELLRALASRQKP